jgi:APA family basic amino acid/polyamine antiporter
VLTGIRNYKELNVAAPLSLALERIPYPWLALLMNLAVIAGLTSVMLVMLLGQSRVFFSMSCDGLLPPLFSKVHLKYRTPWLSNALLMVFVGVFAAFAPIAVVGQITSIGTLLAFVLVCGGIIVLRKTHADHPRPFKTPLVPLVPILGILFAISLSCSDLGSAIGCGLLFGWPSDWRSTLGTAAIAAILRFRAETFTLTNHHAQTSSHFPADFGSLLCTK